MKKSSKQSRLRDSNNDHPIHRDMRLYRAYRAKLVTPPFIRVMSSDDTEPKAAEIIRVTFKK